MRIVFVLLGFFLSCASVSQIETLKETVPRPVYRVLEHGSVDPSPSPLDFKERITTKTIPSYVIQWKEMSIETVESDLRFLEDKIITAHKKYGNFVRTTIAQKISAQDLKDKDIDVILSVSLVKEDLTLKVSISYEDSILPLAYGNASYAFRYETEESFTQNKKRIEVFQNKKSLIPLNTSVYAYWSELFSPNEVEIQTIMESSLRGQVSVYSTSPGTLITLDGKEIGRAPLVDYSVLNGKHTLAFSKPGKDPVARTLIVRSGKKNRIFHEWNDDISQGTVLLTSFPSGLDVIVGGQKKGATQYAEAGIPYGSYPIQFVRSKNNNSFEYANSSIAIHPKTITSLSLPYALEEGVSWEAEDFWNTSGGSPNFVTNFSGNLNFQKNQDLPKGWYGVYSQNIIPDKIESEVKIGLSQELNGRLGVLISEAGGKSNLIIIDKTDFHLVSYSASEAEASVLASYRWKSEDAEKGRVISWSTDPEKQLLKIYLGSTLIFEKPWNFQLQWQIAILTPNNSFLSGNPLRGIKIHYPDMIKFEEKLKK
ncbi:MAG: PEGA domain-containing protein [Leptospira sp.]|nr:PEGA domain-containing protein [Leptospira sp.]